MDPERRVLVLYIDVTRLRRNEQLAVCCVVVLISSLIYGYLLELILVSKKMSDHSWFLSLLLFAGYSFISWTEALLTKKTIGRNIPMLPLMLLGVSSVVTIGFSNSALAYLNYPTQVIFKSCKLIPVMIGGVFIMQKKYGLLDVLACVLMSIGLAALCEHPPKSPQQYYYSALTADAVIGNLQEKAMKNYEASSVEIMCLSFAVGGCLIFFYLLLIGNLFPAIEWVFSNPDCWLPLLALIVTGYISVETVLVLVKQFDALVAVTVTNLRKVFSLVLSFLVFAKPFSMNYVWSGILVAIGVYLNVFSKRLQKQPSKPLLPILQRNSKTEVVGETAVSSDGIKYDSLDIMNA
ncbi:unnamed protein product [Notodromas monacha]|uniref:Adenosine 3'-phospho 5'-phosphosulfate transporter 2 n=1 Tax=Notodromas monacha TaxID=399045 RepID=A0A7R9BDA5_9CRUS|nr:unnamed protein product [Notodromas monacha]CAG0913266.1 unnamed protein product [Notodromas monacha]